MKRLLFLLLIVAPFLSIAQKLPYPVIFIHGLGGDWKTWNDMKTYLQNSGWTFGDYLDYCLNADGNKSTSNLATDAISFVKSNLRAGDFYIIDFNIAPNGSAGNSTIQSNQAGIVKQGAAISDAVERVMNATGRDHVILFGHSMGGLAAREYLQNPYNWVSPNVYHHIAKLVTTGTPHGGSNSDNFFIEYVSTINTESEAVRDLRKSYKRSQAKGVYLFGGREEYRIMDDDSDENFYNVDVNCNGRIGENIIGLNQKTISNNLDFSLIISNYYSLITPPNSDGVVGLHEADLTNYRNICAERFFVTGAHSTHLKKVTFGVSPALPDDTFTNLTALDEPDFLDIAYEVELNQQYIGYFTTQGDDNCDVIPKYVDYDSYVFQVERSGIVQAVFAGINSSGAEVNIYNATKQRLQRTTTQSTSITTQPLFLNAGYYYADLQANVGDNHLDEYQLKLFFNAQTTDVEEPIAQTEISVYPNPASERIYLSSADQINEYIISDVTGKQLLHNIIGNDGIDVSLLPTGMYFIQLNLKTGKIFTQKFNKM